MNRNPANEAVPHRSEFLFLNHQLVGGVIGKMIWDAESKQRKEDNPPLPKLILCNPFWHIENLLCHLKKIDSSLIAERVILSVGFEESRTKYFAVGMFLTCLRHVVCILRQKGCRDMVVTNVPPDAASSRSIRYWRLLETVNAGIEEICRENDDLFFCNVFHLFCIPKNFQRRRDYVIQGAPNYDLKTELYNLEFDVRARVKDPAALFSDEGKRTLHQHVRKTLECRKNQTTIPSKRGRGKNTSSHCDPEVTGSPDLINKLKTLGTYRPDTIAYELSKLNLNYPSVDLTSSTSSDSNTEDEESDNAGGVERGKMNSTSSHDGSGEQERTGPTSERKMISRDPTPWGLSEAEREFLNEQKISSHPFFCACRLCEKWHEKMLAELREIVEELMDSGETPKLE